MYSQDFGDDKNIVVGVVRIFIYLFIYLRICPEQILFYKNGRKTCIYSTDLAIKFLTNHKNTLCLFSFKAKLFREGIWLHDVE